MNEIRLNSAVISAAMNSAAGISSFKQTRNNGGPSDAAATTITLSKRAEVDGLRSSEAGVARTAREIRDADRSLEKVNQYVQEMKKRLTTMMKQFPPYPPDSDERVEALRSISAIRKLIDSLTIPAPGNNLPEIPVVPENASDHEVYEAISRLGEVYDQIQASRLSLHEQIANISSDIWSNSDFLPEQGAEAVSIEVRNSINGQSVSITSGQIPAEQV